MDGGGGQRGNNPSKISSWRVDGSGGQRGNSPLKNVFLKGGWEWGAERKQSLKKCLSWRVDGGQRGKIPNFCPKIQKNLLSSIISDTGLLIGQFFLLYLYYFDNWRLNADNKTFNFKMFRSHDTINICSIGPSFWMRLRTFWTFFVANYSYLFELQSR